MERWCSRSFTAQGDAFEALELPSSRHFTILRMAEPLAPFARGQCVEERLEHAAVSQPREARPRAVSIAEPFGQPAPSDILDGEEVHGFKKEPTVATLVPASRLAGVNHVESQFQVLLRHSCQHDRSPSNRHAMNHRSDSMGSSPAKPSPQPTVSSDRCVAVLGNRFRRLCDLYHPAVVVHRLPRKRDWHFRLQSLFRISNDLNRTQPTIEDRCRRLPSRQDPERAQRLGRREAVVRCKPGDGRGRRGRSPTSSRLEFGLVDVRADVTLLCRRTLTTALPFVAVP